MTKDKTLERARKALQRLALPAWVRGRIIERGQDWEGYPLVRVWLEVDEDFDPGAHADFFPTEEKVEDCLRKAGIEEWIMVRVNSTVPDED